MYVTDNLLNLEKFDVSLDSVNIYPESVNTIIINKTGVTKISIK